MNEALQSETGSEHSSLTPQEITEQLDRVLQSKWFKTSIRCCRLLDHLVKSAVSQRSGHLRERQIAVDLFDRSPAYDNAADPVVRVAAGEVRKRLAQYYGDPQNIGELRIVLPVGSYVPTFQPPAVLGPDHGFEVPDTPLHASSPLSEFSEEQRIQPVESRGPNNPPRWHPTYRLWGALAALVCVAALATYRWHTPTPDASGFDLFWSPLINPPAKPLISVGQMGASSLDFIHDANRNENSESFKIETGKDSAEEIPVQRSSYAGAAADLGYVFGRYRKDFEVKSQGETTFSDLTGRSTIMIGAYDNDWSMELSEGLPFEFRSDSVQHRAWIVAKDHPTTPIGTVPMNVQEPSIYDAYSIVARVSGKISGRTHLIIAGLGDGGTLAAASFVSNPRYLDEFASQLPPHWETKNIEVLLVTKVKGRVVGVPLVSAYKIW